MWHPLWKKCARHAQSCTSFQDLHPQLIFEQIYLQAQQSLSAIDMIKLHFGVNISSSLYDVERYIRLIQQTF